jgi:predicted enzyme related to lactoylglutathione lyase
MGRVVHFEIHASDPERLVPFYTQLFGWRITKVEGMDYWLLSTGQEGTPGIDGGLVRRPGGGPPAPGQSVNAFVCTVDVADCAATVEEAKSLGATVALPRMAVGGVGWLAYLLDPDGNTFGVMQSDPSAA